MSSDVRKDSISAADIFDETRGDGGKGRFKPSRELYRPPTSTANQLNPTAKEFAPLQSSKSFDYSSKGGDRFIVGSGGAAQDNIVLNRTGLTIAFGPNKQGHGLSKSRSTSSQLTAQFQSNISGELTDIKENNATMQSEFRSRTFSSTSNVTTRSHGSSKDMMSRGHMTGQDMIVRNQAGSQDVLSRSITKSQDMMTIRNDWRSQIDISAFTFPQEIITTVTKAMEDPNRVPPRSLMELVKQIINRVISGGFSSSSSQPGFMDDTLPEQAAKLCTGIIENEERKTFQETLINTCQEIYHDREKILRQDINKWNSYITFLNLMYAKLKRRQLHFGDQLDGVAPRFVLLSLLAECCTTTLTSSLKSLAEVEAMFGVLTNIGRDLSSEMPGRMSLLVTCLREAFLNYRLSPQVSKQLLQLIELEAAGWTLPAQAVMYYYPGSTS